MSFLDILIIILVVAWLGGFSMRVAGNLIHLVLVIAVVLFLIRILS